MAAGQDFDPSMLERKDRAELVTIAQSLGGKVPSRAKKADIVGQILQLVGHEPAGTTQPTLDDAAAEASTVAAEVDVAKGDVDADRGPGGANRGDEHGTSAGRDENGSGSSRPAVGSGGPDVEEAGSAEPQSPRRGRGGGRAQGPRSETEAQSAAPQSTDAGASSNPTGDQQSGSTDSSDPSGQSGPGRQPNQGRQGGNQPGNQGGNQPGTQQGNQGGNQQGGSQQGGSQQGNQGGNQGGTSQNNQPAGPGNEADPSPSQGQSGPGQPGDDGESGNRRRRRRGRDRERRPEQGDDQVMAEPVDVEGIVDLREEGYGFLRINGYLPSRDDAYLSVKQVRQFGLRRGDVVTGKSRAANRNEKNPALLQLDAVNGRSASGILPERPRFEELTPLFPDERLRLEQPEFPENMTARIIDLIAPIGKGQRGLIVSPPKAGKTTIMKQIVRAVERNNPEVHLIVLLVDERPEEVTDMRRWMLHGEVAASTFDRPSEEHIAVAELVIDRAKRLVEQGQDVVIMLDGITRLARAYNLAAPTTGRVMAGGIDTGALYPPKKFFGAARNMEEGGSLTILATALVETNTRMDEVIFEEFKGTGNMELKLDRRLAERRIYPAIDVDASSTRHEELLYDRKQLAQIWKLRRVLSGMKDETGSNAAGLEMLTERLLTFKTNEAFLAEVAKGTAGS